MAELADLPAGRQARTFFMDYYVYILKSNDGSFYKGMTNNLEKRLKQHILEQTQTTKRMKIFKLVHVEICKDRKNARKMEKFFKSGYGREILKELFSD